MIGPKKLSAIQEELRTALTATGGAPLRSLEKRLADSARQPAAVGGESAVLRSLRRIIESPKEP